MESIKILKNSFWQIFFPMLLAFIGYRLMLQTDLIMIGPLGEVALAAFGVPMRIMWIDTIVVLAMVPIAGVYLSTIPEEKKSNAIAEILGVGFYLSLALVAISFICYPYLINFFIINSKVAQLSWQAIFWLTISIPIRFNVSLNQMMLFSLGKGNSVNLINIIVLLMNAFLDWMFIYKFSFGFQGAFISTVFVSCLQCLGGIWIVSEYISILRLFKISFKMVKNILSMTSPELIRLIAYNLTWFVSLTLFASQLSDINLLSAYSVYTEFYFFMSMFLVVLMRTVAITLAQKEKTTNKEKYEYIWQIGWKGLPILIIIMFLLYLLRTIIGQDFYHMHGIALEWWSSAILIFVFALPIYYWNALQRGLWQSMQKFSTISILEIIFYWGIFIPAIYLGLVYHNSYLPWIGAAVAEFSLGSCLLISSGVTRTKKFLFKMTSAISEK